jgi:hypothetical protein
MATYIQIGSTVTVGAGGAASIDFTSIPATYTDLLIRISARTNRSGQPVDSLKLTFNGATTNFSARGVGADASSGSGFSFNNAGSASIEDAVFMTAATATANTFGSADIYIPNYAGSTNKSVSSDSVTENNATQSYLLFDAGLWSNTSAITSIKLAPLNGSLINQYSTASLYGISKS